MKQFYEEFNGVIYAFALRRLYQPTDAADVLNDVMLEVWRKANSFEGRSKVKTWVLGIANHKILDKHRKASKQSEYEDADSEVDEQAGDYKTLGVMVNAENADFICQCLQRLSDIHRQTVHLVFFQDLSYSEIAELMQCPGGTVKTRMLHAKNKLKRCLEALGASV